MKLYSELMLCTIMLGLALGAPNDVHIRRFQEQAMNPSSYVYSQLENLQADKAASVEDLRQELERKREETRIPPVDAKIDPIWKAIPDLNGLEVDVEKTMQAAHHSAEKPFPIIYRQIPAAVKLKDLPAAPIFRGNPGKKQIALMINVAWGEEYLPKMMSSLKQAGVSATFFLDGSWVTKHPEIAKQIKEEGFEIGNHAFHHPDMKQLSSSRQREEIASTNDAIFKATGVKANLFAPPSGSFNQATVNIASDLGMKTILWTADTIDWQRPSPDTIIRRIMKKSSSGALVLMHPTSPTSEALPVLIRSLKEKGYELVSVSSLLDPNREPSS